MYTERNQRKTKELNNRRDIYSWIVRLKTVKMSTLSKLIYRFNPLPIIIQQNFLYIDKGILKFTRKSNVTRKDKIILIQKKVRGNTISDFKTLKLQ